MRKTLEKNSYLGGYKNYYGTPTPIYRNRRADYTVRIFLRYGNRVFLRKQNQAEKYGYPWQKECESRV